MQVERRMGGPESRGKLARDLVQGGARALRLLALAAMLALVAGLPAAAAIHALEARVSARAMGTEIDLDMTGRTDFRVFTLDGPRRVVIDLKGLDWAGMATPVLPGGPVTGLRFGVFRPGWGRLVLDLAAPMAVERALFVATPEGRTRFRLRLVPSTGPAFVARSGTPPGAGWMPVAPAPRADPAEDDRRVVVVDPGHGGIDPGALRDGMVEKEIALAAARILAARLTETGRYRVVMTRDADIFLPLGERVRRARAAKADVFLSIHANTEPTGLASGVSVFTLSEEASDEAAERLAALENRADVIAGLDLDGETSTVARILVDLARAETNLRSRRLAEGIVRRFDEDRRMIRSNPHRYAGFRVLKAPDVPSILIELGFLTNEQDRARLGSRDWTEALAVELVTALDAWFEAEASRQARLR